MRKKEGRLSFTVDDIIIYVENPMNVQKKGLELKIEYSKTAGFKVNT